MARRTAIKWLSLLALSASAGWGGYVLSVQRARALLDPAELEGRGLASTGAEPGILSSGELGAGRDGYRISALSVFSNVILHISDSYVDPSRVNPREMLVGALTEIERQVAEILVEDLGDGRVKISIPGQQKIITVNDVESAWEINLKLREVFRFFEKHLPPQKDIREIEYAAANGALSTLDPHSVLLKPEAFQDMKTSTKGEFGGLGIVISVRDGKLTIMSPLEGTPATRAGLRALDQITRIGDVSTVSMAIDEAVNMLRGPVGSKVTIWVLRKGWPEAKKFSLTREVIKIESVESKLLDDRIGYVRIKNFQQNTGSDLDAHVERLTKEAKAPLKGLVLDLRNNPGGLLEQAIRVSDKFLASGDIVTTVGYSNKVREPKRAQWSSTDVDFPVAVLVNNGSASASEIVAGALKNLDRAVIVGETSFGKGSVQVLFDFADNSALKLTIAQYLTPGGISIQNVGVKADVELSPAYVDKDVVRLFWEPESHREVTLDKHLERQRPEQEERDDGPRFALSYLVEPEVKDEPKGKDAKAPEPKPEDADEDEEAPTTGLIREDYPMKFARRLLTAAGRNTRAQTLEQAKRFLEEKRAEEEQRIAAAISAAGVDWTAGPRPASKPALDVALRFVNARDGAHVDAGGDLVVEATLTNRGAETWPRLRGVLETDHPSLRGRELLFGTLAPGASRTATVKTSVPRELAARSDRVTLKLGSGPDLIDAEATVPLVTHPIARPAFAYSLTFDDATRGDGDGVLEAGEGVDFLVWITNVGGGAAEKTVAHVKSAAGEGLFLERGRVEIGAVPAGETRIARLQFKLPEGLPEKALALELELSDQASGERFVDELSLMPEPREPTAVTARKVPLVTAEDAFVHAGAGVSTVVLGTLPKGTALAAVARTERWIKVDLGGELSGWVEGSRTKAGKASAKATFAHVPARRGPVIELVGEPAAQVVAGDALDLSGVISGRELRDMYIVANDRKVYYASRDAAAPAPAPRAPANVGGNWSPPDERAATLRFEKRVPLKEGMNRIYVLGRLDDRVSTYKALFVTRAPAAAPRVAEATPEGSAREGTRPVAPAPR
jgi:carboxyl-terminal processing protease